MNTVVQLVLVLGIVLIVLAIGLRARRADLLLLLRNPLLGGRAMLSMFVAFPLFVVLVAWYLPLEQPVRTALLALAVSPMPPVLPKSGTTAGSRGDYVVGLQILATVVSIFVVPGMGWVAGRIYGVDANYDVWAMAQVLLVTVCVPMAVGVELARLLPRVAQRIALIADRAGSIAMVLGTVVALFASAPAMARLIGQGTLIASAAIIGFGLCVGHLLGGPDPGNRGALAVATAARHPGVALVLATGVFPEHETAISGAVELYLLANLLLTIPYVRWRRRIAAAG